MGSFDDQRKGTVSQGMLADLVVLSDDVLTSPGKLKTASVLATIFDGRSSTAATRRRSPRRRRHFSTSSTWYLPGSPAGFSSISRPG